MNRMKLRFLIFLACLSLISSFAKMPTAYSCPPPACPECTIRSGYRCVRNCLSNPLLCCYCASSLCSDDCSWDCCPPEGWCPVVSFDDLYPNHHTCSWVGFYTGFNVQLPFRCYCPSCCDYLIWDAPGGYPAHWEGGCFFSTYYYTPGEYTVTASLPCGSSDSITVTVCDTNEFCCGGKCCKNWQCCIDGNCVDPICDNCFTASFTFYECYHEEGDVNCATNKCLKNVLYTASCWWKGANWPCNKTKCDTKEDFWEDPKVIQYEIEDPNVTCPGGVVEYELLFMLWWGCDFCWPDFGWVSCMTTPSNCSGVPKSPANIGIKKVCGCD